MPHERTLYSRIETIIREVDRRTDRLGTPELAKLLHDARLPQFTTFFQEPNKPQKTPRYTKPTTIARFIRFAIRLDLLADARALRLTKAGRAALKPGKYAGRLSTQVNVLFEKEKGFQFREVRQAINDILETAGKELPHSSAIYGRIRVRVFPGLNEVDVRWLLNLKADCGDLSAWQKKLYLP